MSFHQNEVVVGPAAESVESAAGMKKPAYRMFFSTDVHGSDICFRKFLAAARVYQADALVLGGDLAGKGLVPVRRCGDGVELVLHGRTWRAGPADRDELLARVGREGLYPVEVEDEDDLERLRSDQVSGESVLRQEIASQLERWCRLASERLASTVRLVITPGNDDPHEIDAVLCAAERVESPEHEVVRLGPVQLASIGEVPPTPWRTERELCEAELADEIERVLARASDDVPVAFNFHSPPYDSGLDQAPELDSALKPVIRGTQQGTVPVGSHAVRDAILRHRPIVALHGHIHEARAFRTIGRTVCLNPGSQYSVGTLCGALVDFDARGQIVDYALTAG